MFSGSVRISDSIQQGLDQLVGFLPRLIGFLIILVIGWLIARAVKALLVRALEGVGLDRALDSGAAGPYVARAMPDARPSEDRKSTRLNSSHSSISYAGIRL